MMSESVFVLQILLFFFLIQISPTELKMNIHFTSNNSLIVTMKKTTGFFIEIFIFFTQIPRI